MKGIVDVGQKITAWLSEIAKLEDQVNRDEQAIKEQEEKIKEAEQKKIELQEKVKFGRELLGETIPESSAVAPSVRRRRTAIFQTLPKAIIQIVDSQPEKFFTSLEIVDKLIERGFKSKSKQFKVLVQITLNKMAKAGRIHFMKDGRFVTYSSFEGKKKEGLSLIK
ncbi:MAG TPA: hypothetical protein DD713_01840 [Nitrospiraceae bacterium]|nr:hypothetical protein [Nitrospiraceae bacterium]